MQRLLHLKLIARHGTSYLLALALFARIWRAYGAKCEPICQSPPVYETVKHAIIIRPGYALITKHGVGPVHTGRRINHDLLVCRVNSNGSGIPACIAVQPYDIVVISGHRHRVETGGSNEISDRGRDHRSESWFDTASAIIRLNTGNEPSKNWRLHMTSLLLELSSVRTLTGLQPVNT